MPKKLSVLGAEFLLGSVLSLKIVESIKAYIFYKERPRNTLYPFAICGCFIGWLCLCKSMRNCFSRHCEQEADRQSAQELNCADGAIRLWKRFVPETRTKSKETNFFKKQMKKIIDILLGDTHPSFNKRIQCMEKLAQEFEPITTSEA